MKTKDIKMPYWMFALSLFAVGAVASGIVYFSTKGGKESAVVTEEPEAVATLDDPFAAFEPETVPFSPWWMESSMFDWSDPMERMREMEERFFGQLSDPTQWPGNVHSFWGPMNGGANFGGPYTLNEDDEKFEIFVPVQEGDETNIETTVEGRSLRISVESKRKAVDETGTNAYASRSERQKVLRVPLPAPVDESGVRVEMSENELRVVVPKRSES